MRRQLNDPMRPTHTGGGASGEAPMRSGVYTPADWLQTRGEHPEGGRIDRDEDVLYPTTALPSMAISDHYPVFLAMPWGRGREARIGDRLVLLPTSLGYPACRSSLLLPFPVFRRFSSRWSLHWLASLRRAVPRGRLYSPSCLRTSSTFFARKTSVLRIRQIYLGDLSRRSGTLQIPRSSPISGCLPYL